MEEGSGAGAWVPHYIPFMKDRTNTNGKKSTETPFQLICTWLL